MKIKNKFLFFSLFFLIVGICGFIIWKFLFKPLLPLPISEKTFLKERMESTPIRWTDGRVLTVVSLRPLRDPYGKAIEIYDQNGARIAQFNSSLGLLSAFVANEKLYIFGSTKWSGENEIQMIYTDDLKNFTLPQTVLKAAPGQTLFNSSITPGPDGEYVMAYEICGPEVVCFSVRFAKSKDLINWTKLDALFKVNTYTACPTIRYVAGRYYLFYLKIMGAEPNLRFVTAISRSRDLKNWSDSLQLVVEPAADGTEGVNTSDLDLVESDDQLIVNFAVGRQDAGEGSWVNIKQRIYPATLEQYVESFF